MAEQTQDMDYPVGEPIGNGDHYAEDPVRRRPFVFALCFLLGRVNMSFPDFSLEGYG